MVSIPPNVLATRLSRGNFKALPPRIRAKVTTPRRGAPLDKATTATRALVRVLVGCKVVVLHGRK